MAERLTAEGARVALTDLHREPLEQLCARINASGGDAVWRVADLRDEVEVAAVVAATVEAFGGIDILYNNAGVRLAGRDGPVVDVDRDVWDDTFAVNVTGTYLFCKHAIPHLLQSATPVVINVSSTAGIGGDAEAHAYSASKGALIALTKSIAQTWGGDGLRAVVICPGLIETPMLEAAFAGEQITRDLLARTALGRVGQSEEIAGVAAFLASDDGSYVTSTVVEVHGGLAK